MKDAQVGKRDIVRALRSMAQLPYLRLRAEEKRKMRERLMHSIKSRHGIDK